MHGAQWAPIARATPTPFSLIFKLPSWKVFRLVRKFSERLLSDVKRCETRLRSSRKRLLVDGKYKDIWTPCLIECYRLLESDLGDHRVINCMWLSVYLNYFCILHVFFIVKVCVILYCLDFETIKCTLTFVVVCFWNGGWKRRKRLTKHSKSVSEGTKA